MSRRITAALVLLLGAALAGCGSRTGPAPQAAPPPGAALDRAAEVAHAWDGSAAQRSWLTGYYPTGLQEWLPSDVFHSGSDKAAFFNGLLDLRAPLPPWGPAPTGQVVWPDGSTLNLPLLTSDAVFRSLTEGKPPCQDRCGDRLTVTAVRPGVRQTATSRGEATIPVWEFTIAGYSQPFAYPAVAPQATLPQPPQPHPLPPGVLAAGWTGADGLTVHGMVTHGDCDELLPGEVYETDAAVVLIAHSRSTLKAGQACDAAARSGPADFHLGRPLGTRTVLDLATGLPQTPVQERRPLGSTPQQG
ncbi:hypothetical protein [Kitasatospora sp. McL0602]|uniref:hypothetical protein n=1 Tax=Kitasatospora sp. McL0602 TaxID=3439530 RepID=UPI003F8BEB20